MLQPAIIHAKATSNAKATVNRHFVDVMTFQTDQTRSETREGNSPALYTKPAAIVRANEFYFSPASAQAEVDRVVCLNGRPPSYRPHC